MENPELGRKTSGDFMRFGAASNQTDADAKKEALNRRKIMRLLKSGAIWCLAVATLVWTARISHAASRAPAKSGSSERARAVSEFRKTAARWIDAILAKSDADAIRGLTARLSQATEELEKGPDRQEREGATRGNLGSIRSALSLYYPEHGQRYPQDLGDLPLRPIPKADTVVHPPSDAVVSACDPDSLPDKGGWAYCSDPASPNYGFVWVDCSHADSRGVRWNTY